MFEIQQREFLGCGHRHDLIIQIAEEVFNRLQLTLDKLDHLPYTIHLCGGGSSLDLLVDALQESSWYRNLPFTRKPMVRHIRPEQVAGIKDNTGRVNDHTYITAMGLLRVGLDTLQFNGTNSGSIREKIDRMLQV